MSKKSPNSLMMALDKLLLEAKGNGVSVQTILHVLAGKGQAALLVLFSIPFCLMIQAPGLSTPFGIIMAFLGLRIAFGNRVWVPKKLLAYTVSYGTLKKVCSLTSKISDKLSFFTTTRLSWIVQTKKLHLLHGVTIFLLSIVLALPLPIPFTNFIVALPLLIFGLGLLEDDGVLIICAYFLAFIGILAFSALFFFGKSLYGL